MRIGQDLDGCVVAFEKAANKYIADYLGVEEKPVDRWGFYENYGKKGYGAWRSLWDRAVAKEHLFQHCEPIPGAVPALQLLEDEGHEIVYITHRKPDAEYDTRAWLTLRGILHDVHFVRDKSLIDCDIYFDDKPENVRDLLNAGKCAYLFDRPWNESSSLPRVIGWGEVVQVVTLSEQAVKA